MLFSAPTLSDRFKLQITYPKRNRPLSGLVKPFVHTPNYPCKPKKGGRVWNAFIVGAHWKCQQLLLFLAPCKIRYRHHLIRKGAIKWEYIYCSAQFKFEFWKETWPEDRCFARRALTVLCIEMKLLLRKIMLSNGIGTNRL